MSDPAMTHNMSVAQINYISQVHIILSLSSAAGYSNENENENFNFLSHINISTLSQYTDEYLASSAY